MADSNFATLFQHETDLLEVPAGQTLFREGDEMGGAGYVLISGAGEIRVSGSVVEIAKPGALPGDAAMMDEGVRLVMRSPRVCARRTALSGIPVQVYEGGAGTASLATRSMTR